MPLDDTTKTERTRTIIDVAAGTVTSGETTYSIAGIPDNVRAHLALFGLYRTLTTASDPAATLARLQAGELPSRGRKKAKENPWRLAYAYAKVEATKKTDEPVSFEDAKAAAHQLDAAKLREIKTHPLVVKHYARLTGAASELV